MIVTHNMQQAARVSDVTAFFTIESEGEPGADVRPARPRDIFTRPRDPRTQDYVTGRFG